MMDSFEIRKKIKDPEYQFNSEEIAYIDNNYMKLSYYPIYKSMYLIQYFIRDIKSIVEPEIMKNYKDFGVKSWESARLFTIDIIKTGTFSMDDLIVFIGQAFKIPQTQLRRERKYLQLIENVISLSDQLNLFNTPNLPTEIIDLIKKRIDTISYSYLEMVDVLNFIDYGNIAYMGRLNEYDFYPMRIWERYDDLISKEEVKNILMEIYDEMFGFDCNLNQNNLNGFDFINVFDGNEYLKEPYNNFTLGQRLDMGAQMILYIKEKYPLLAQFHISRT